MRWINSIMDKQEILELMTAFRSSKLKHMTLEDGDFKLILEAAEQPLVSGATVGSSAVDGGANFAFEDIEEATEKEDDDDDLIRITAPLVGTFYRAPEEEAEPYVTVGDTVKKGQTLFIIEAMKMLNYIEAPSDGVVHSIKAENGSMVEFDQVLLELRPHV